MGCLWSIVRIPGTGKMERTQDAECGTCTTIVKHTCVGSFCDFLLPVAEEEELESDGHVIFSGNPHVVSVALGTEDRMQEMKCDAGARLLYLCFPTLLESCWQSLGIGDNLFALRYLWQGVQSPCFTLVRFLQLRRK